VRKTNKVQDASQKDATSVIAKQEIHGEASSKNEDDTRGG